VRARRLPYEFPGANHYGREEEAAILRVIRARSPFRYYGPKLQGEVGKFEAEFAARVGVRYALGVNSGTQALAVAMGALGVGPGAEVIVPAYMWVSVIGAVVRLGAIPVLAEIDDSFTLDPRDLEERITPRTRLVVAVHMSGAPADLTRILAVARQHRLPVLEDCAQANGATFRGRPVGGIGAMGIFSLQLNKNMTTGEGGVVTTNSKPLSDRACAIHDLGYPRVDGRLVLRGGPLALWGFGGRMGELAGAVGRVQLRKLPRIVGNMRAAKGRIKAGLAGLAGLTFRRLNDPAGDTGAFLIASLPSAGHAAEFARRLNAENITVGLSPTMRVADFGMHVYYNIPALVEKRSNSPDGSPWSLEANRKSVYAYLKGAMPRSDELMARSIIMPVPSVLMPRDIDDVICGFEKVARTVLG
jgi:8-amino-3,8-dideoxy-alpha-D-manno-octulosonate transaminase